MGFFHVFRCLNFLFTEIKTSNILDIISNENILFIARNKMTLNITFCSELSINFRIGITV